MPEPTDYCRSKDGSVIHRVHGCHWADAGTVPWRWAAGKSTDQIIQDALSDGGPGLLRQLRFCYFCMGRLPERDKTNALEAWSSLSADLMPESDAKTGGIVEFWNPEDHGVWGKIVLVPHECVPGPVTAWWVGFRWHDASGELTPSKAKLLGEALIAAGREAEARYGLG